MNLFGKNAKRILSSILSASMILGLLTVGVSAEEEYSWNEGSTVQPSQTYEVQVTDEQRELIHAEVDKLAGDPGDGVYHADKLDQTTLVGGLTKGSTYNSISYGSGAAGAAPAEYPFRVPNTEKNFNEGDRKAAKYAWVVQLAKDLGFEKVVQRQDDKYVYVEIGDPDAPEMVMALSHLDSPTAANNASGNLLRWRNADGDLDQEAYYNGFVRDGWVYGTGVQDDSGPCLATLYAAAALKNAGLLGDRRIRIVMGSYEDSNPGVPSVTNTLKYMDIPYYTANPSFYDNWAYKSLNREEIPIAAYTSDSRFPVIIGNTQNLTNKVLGTDLSADMGKPFGLQRLSVNATLRENDPTLEDIVYGSAAQVASRAYFVINVDGASAWSLGEFMVKLGLVSRSMGWSFSTKANEAPTLAGGVATSGRVNNVSAVYDDEAKTVTIDINTDVAMEYPTPHYAPNAVVWGMTLLSKALPVNNALKTAAKGIDALFGKEGEDYIGKSILDESLLRNADNGAPNLTIAIGYITNKDLDAAANSYYNAETGELQLRTGVRSLYATKELYEAARDQFMAAIEGKGFEFYTLANDGTHTAGFTAYSNPTLYLTHDNPLTALQFASYGATMSSDPEAFDDVIGLLDISAPIGTTGGTLASNYRNKMTAFGAIIPGNERWWHSANERISVKSIIQMTKLMADGMLEMATYSGPAGAQLMWADIEGLNADRADLDLLDVTVGTYVDASEKVTAEALGNQTLLGATSFEIPMWIDRGNTTKSDAVYKLGHEAGGIYLPVDNADYVANTFVMPMRLEFKVEKPATMSEATWQTAIENNLQGFTFSIIKDGKSIDLALKRGDKAANFYSVRGEGDNVYVAVNLAIVDGTYGDGSVKTVLADSKTDLYKLNADWEAANGNPFPERGKVEKRGFFVISDGEKDAEFHSPDAIYVSVAPEGKNLTFVFPEETYGTDVTATLSLVKGYPTSTSVSASWLKTNTLYENVGATGCPMPSEPGLYSYYVAGTGYYTVCKVFNLTEEDIKAGTKVLTVEGGKYKGTGYEPTITPADAPATYKQDSRDATLINWPDEVLKNAFSVEPQGYKTPAFTQDHAAHELTSQEKMEAYIQQRVNECGYMYLYSAGKSPALNMNLPLVIISTTPIPADATLEEAAAIVTADGKTNIWYQSQIHPNEPASGEASLVMIDHFIDDPEYQEYLKTVNVILIPRINPEGSYLYSRATYGGFDMNRDHTSLKAAELAQLHTAWRLFKSEVVIDTHEFNWYGARNDTVYDSDDIETTPATSLNHSAVLSDIALDMSGTVFEAEKAAGLRVDHYQGTGWTANPPIGRCYFGLLDCLSFLIETRGIGGGMNGFERRVRSQEVAVTGYIKYTAEHASEIKQTVADERAKLIESGKTYDPDSKYALYQTASGERVTPYLSTSYAVDMYTGEWIPTQENWALNLNDTMERSRVRPTAYVIPADHENIDKILYIMDNQGAEYYKLDDGASATLEQYYYVGPYVAKSGRTVGFEADLRDATKVTFEKGAYVFPMDQLAANVIAAICEPDVNDSNGYDGSLVQYGVVTYDATTKNYPIYRYTGNDPRYTLATTGELTKIQFVYNEEIKDSETTIELYKGFPTSSSSTLETMIKNKQLVAIEPTIEGNDSLYYIAEPGTYSYHISGEGYYNILKLVNITADDLANNDVIKLVPVGGKLGSRADEEFSDGYQPTVKPSKAPDSYVMDARDAMLCIWTDEILNGPFSMDNTTGHEPYNTPAFDGTDAAHEVTSQEELMAFVKDRDAKCDYMHLYSAGTTPNYKFDIPMAIFTKSEIPAGATVEEAAQIMKESGKPSVWYQTQIHPNEPAAGEGALVIMDKFINDPETRDLLDNINVIIVPRINPDGSYLFSRATYDGFDMNRDHMSLKAAELAQLHTAYRLFMSEVVIDGHEFTFYGANTAGYMNNADDVETTPATSLNHDAKVTEMALGFSGKAFEDATNAGLRVYHYGTTVNNPIGRAYFGLFNCLSFLVETRGIGAGRTNFERRVFSQETVIMSYITSAAKNAEAVKSVVAEARAKTIELGKTYDENDLLGLYQTASGKTKTEYTATRYQFNLDGTRHENASYENVALNLNDTLARSRVRPTAYVIPADAENIDKILYIMDNQGAEYYKLDAGSSATLEQYYYVGQRTGARYAVDIEAGLRDATKVTFTKGAYVFPMDQVAANVIAMLVEPDVTDSVGYDGTLFQYGVVTYDETTKNFPLYRYTGNDPRTTLVSNEDPNHFFIDVPADAWYAAAVDFVVANGLMVGTSDITFSPDDNLTRAMVVQILWAKEGKPASEAEMTFADVEPDEWYTEAIRWAAANGIVGGYSATAFGPNDPVTREQLVAILYQYAKKSGMDVSAGETTNILDYVDADQVAEYAVTPFQWACGSVIVSGKPGNLLDPTGLTTRAEAAQMLMRLCNLPA